MTQEHISAEKRAERVMMSTRYAGSIHEAIAELAQAIREAENAAYEKAARSVAASLQHALTVRSSPGAKDMEVAADSIRSLRHKDTP